MSLSLALKPGLETNIPPKSQAMSYRYNSEFVQLTTANESSLDIYLFLLVSGVLILLVLKTYLLTHRALYLWLCKVVSMWLQLFQNQWCCTQIILYLLLQYLDSGQICIPILGSIQMHAHQRRCMSMRIHANTDLCQCGSMPMQFRALHMIWIRNTAKQ